MTRHLAQQLTPGKELLLKSSSHSVIQLFSLIFDSYIPLCITSIEKQIFQILADVKIYY
jgi:hypothetical protein